MTEEGAVLNIWGIDWALTGEEFLGVGSVDLDDVGFQFSNGVLFVAPHPTEPAWRLRLPHDEFIATPGSS